MRKYVVNIIIGIAVMLCFFAVSPALSEDSQLTVNERVAKLEITVADLQRQVKALSAEKRVVIEQEKETVKSRGNVGPSFVYYNRNPYAPKIFHNDHQYTERNYRRVYKGEEVQRDNYERQHGERYVSPR